MPIVLELNKQPIEAQHLRDDGALEIVSVFDTIQGEGPFAGIPAVFVRTAGCDLLCPHCDSDYTSNRVLLSAAEIAVQVQEKRKSGLVVITGGEPLRQNIGPLCEMLLANGHNVQIETNGTLFVPGVPYSRITTVCSPKTPELNPFLKARIDYLKYVVQWGQIDESDGLPITALGRSSKVIRPWAAIHKDHIFIQPLDQTDPNLNRLNTQAAVQSCMKFGYRFCLQVHKYIGLD